MAAAPAAARLVASLARGQGCWAEAGRAGAGHAAPERLVVSSGAKLVPRGAGIVGYARNHAGLNSLKSVQVRVSNGCWGWFKSRWGHQFSLTVFPLYNLQLSRCHVAATVQGRDGVSAAGSQAGKALRRDNALELGDPAVRAACGRKWALLPRASRRRGDREQLDAQPLDRFPTSGSACRVA